MTDARPASATYVFCIIQTSVAPSLRGAPPSVPGAGPVRLLDMGGGLWTAVADAPLERFAGPELEQELGDLEALSRIALAHATVIEFFFRQATVIPLKLLTLFSSDDRVRAHISRRRRSLLGLLKRLRGYEEWGIRIVAGTEPPPRAAVTSGRSYLEARKRLNDQRYRPSRRVVSETGAALRRLSRRAAKVRRQQFPPPGEGRAFVIGGSVLVKANRRRNWQKEASKVRTGLEKQGHSLDLTGPWPPYHFAG